MTEAEWLASADPKPMLEFLGEASDRKLRLFGAWCCAYHLGGYLTPPEQTVLKAYERRLDGQLSDQEWFETYSGAGGAVLRTEIQFLLSPDPVAAAKRSAAGNYGLTTLINRPGIIQSDNGRKCVVLRDLFGNPFRPATLSPFILCWNDGTIRNLAQTIYDERTFDRLPILADALEEAGCVDEAILGHCRQPGEHVRGCWVIDLLTGRG
jgi:hypothetical protein